MTAKGGRLWQRTRDREVIENLLNGKLARALFHPTGGETGQIRLIHDPSGRLISECEATSLPPGRVTVWTRAGRHVELDLNVVESENGSGQMFVEPLEARISAVERTIDRVNVINEAVLASNFAISRPAVTIDAAGVHLGVAGRLIVKEVEKQMAREYPGVRIYELDDPTRPPETRILAGSTRSILIADTSDPRSFEPMSEEFADLGALLKPKGLWDSTVRRYHSERIGSVLTVPLLYETPGAVHVFSFMHLTSPVPNELNFAVLCRWREIAFDIQERLAGASPVQVKDRQRILDISESGAKLSLTNPDLVRYVPEQSRMSFDLVFRLQAPVRVNSVVVYVRPEEDHLIAGVHFRGFGFSEAPIDLRERLRTYIKMIHN